jgi:hypothetical protein
MFVLGFVVASLGQQLGLSSFDLDAILSQLPPVPPVVYISLAPELLANQEAVVVATGSYSVDQHHVRSARVYVFLKTEDVWVQAFATEEDERLAAHQAPGYWEIALDHIEYADVDGDGLSEVAIFWNSSPMDGMGFSLIQYQRILDIVDYDTLTERFREITDDSIVYYEFMEDALLLDADGDGRTEIVRYKQIWEGDTCVECPKRYRISVWAVRGGALVPDQKWNNGLSLETEDQFSLSPCDRITLVRLVLEKSACRP